VGLSVSVECLVYGGCCQLASDVLTILTKTETVPSLSARRVENGRQTDEIVGKAGPKNYAIKRLGELKTRVVRVDRTRPCYRHRALNLKKLNDGKDFNLRTSTCVSITGEILNVMNSSTGLCCRTRSISAPFDVPKYRVIIVSQQVVIGHKTLLREAQR
jgi:hypothetical protein